MAEDFASLNKVAVVEEMGITLQSINNFIEELIASQDEISRSNVMVGISHQIGYLSALYNQYKVLETGELPSKKQTRIGFATTLDENKE